MRQKLLKVPTIILVTIFLINTIGWAAPGQSIFAKPGNPVDTINQPLLNSTLAAEIYIPEQYGSISQNSGLRIQDSAKKIILIKDAHCVYEAQKNIEKILDILIRDYKIDLICVEGASGEVDPSVIAGSPDKKRREEVADEYLKRGYLTAAEVLAMSKGKGYGFSIWGAEDFKLYLEDLKVFRDVYNNSAAAQKFITLSKRLISDLKQKIYQPDVLEFDRNVNFYHVNELSLTDYVQYLYTKNEGIFGKYPNVRSILKLVILEKAINYKTVEKEREEIIQGLCKQLPKEEIQNLVKKSLLYKLGKIAPENYYCYLGQLAAIDDLLSKKSFYRYLRLMKLRAKLNEEELFVELESLTEETYRRLITDSVVWKFYQTTKSISRLDKISRLAMSRKELLEYRNNMMTIAAVAELLRIQAGGNKLTVPSDFSNQAFLEEVTDFFKTPELFYEYAIQRDKALVDNLIAKMENSGENKAVLVAGGFHAQGIKELLEQKEIAVVTITPSITKDDPQAKHIYLSRIMDDLLDPEDILAGLAGQNISPALITANEVRDRCWQIIRRINDDLSLSVYHYQEQIEDALSDEEDLTERNLHNVGRIIQEVKDLLEDQPAAAIHLEALLELLEDIRKDINMRLSQRYGLPSSEVNALIERIAGDNNIRPYQIAGSDYWDLLVAILDLARSTRVKPQVPVKPVSIYEALETRPLPKEIPLEDVPRILSVARHAESIRGEQGRTDVQTRVIVDQIANLYRVSDSEVAELAREIVQKEGIASVRDLFALDEDASGALDKTVARAAEARVTPRDIFRVMEADISQGGELTIEAINAALLNKIGNEQQLIELTDAVERHRRVRVDLERMEREADADGVAEACQQFAAQGLSVERAHVFLVFKLIMNTAEVSLINAIEHFSGIAEEILRDAQRETNKYSAIYRYYNDPARHVYTRITDLSESLQQTGTITEDRDRSGGFLAERHKVSSLARKMRVHQNDVRSVREDIADSLGDEADSQGLLMNLLVLTRELNCGLRAVDIYQALEDDGARELDDIIEERRGQAIRIPEPEELADYVSEQLKVLKRKIANALRESYSSEQFDQFLTALDQVGWENGEENIEDLVTAYDTLHWWLLQAEKDTMVIGNARCIQITQVVQSAMYGLMERSIKLLRTEYSDGQALQKYTRKGYGNRRRLQRFIQIVAGYTAENVQQDGRIIEAVANTIPHSKEEKRLYIFNAGVSISSLNSIDYRYANLLIDDQKLMFADLCERNKDVQAVVFRNKNGIIGIDEKQADCIRTMFVYGYEALTAPEREIIKSVFDAVEYQDQFNVFVARYSQPLRERIKEKIIEQRDMEQKKGALANVELMTKWHEALKDVAKPKFDQDVVAVEYGECSLNYLSAEKRQDENYIKKAYDLIGNGDINGYTNLVRGQTISLTRKINKLIQQRASQSDGDAKITDAKIKVAEKKRVVWKKLVFSTMVNECRQAAGAGIVKKEFWQGLRSKIKTELFGKDPEEIKNRPETGEWKRYFMDVVHDGAALIVNESLNVLEERALRIEGTAEAVRCGEVPSRVNDAPEFLRDEINKYPRPMHNKGYLNDLAAGLDKLIGNAEAKTDLMDTNLDKMLPLLKRMHYEQWHDVRNKRFYGRDKVAYAAAIKRGLLEDKMQTEEYTFDSEGQPVKYVVRIDGDEHRIALTDGEGNLYIFSIDIDNYQSWDRYERKHDFLDEQDSTIFKIHRAIYETVMEEFKHNNNVQSIVENITANNAQRVMEKVMVKVMDQGEVVERKLSEQNGQIDLLAKLDYSPRLWSGEKGSISLTATGKMISSEDAADWNILKIIEEIDFLDGAVETAKGAGERGGYVNLEELADINSRKQEMDDSLTARKTIARDKLTERGIDVSPEYINKILELFARTKLADDDAGVVQPVAEEAIWVEIQKTDKLREKVSREVFDEVVNKLRTDAPERAPPGGSGSAETQGGAIGQWEAVGELIVEDGWLLGELQGIGDNEGRRVQLVRPGQLGNAGYESVTIRAERALDVEPQLERNVRHQAARWKMKAHALDDSDEKNDIIAILDGILTRLPHLYIVSNNDYIDGYGLRDAGGVMDTVCVADDLLLNLMGRISEPEGMTVEFIALFHEVGHVMGFSHTELRGLGKDARTGERTQLTPAEAQLPEQLGLQDILFNNQRNMWTTVWLKQRRMQRSRRRIEDLPRTVYLDRERDDRYLLFRGLLHDLANEVGNIYSAMLIVDIDDADKKRLFVNKMREKSPQAADLFVRKDIDQIVSLSGFYALGEEMKKDRPLVALIGQHTREVSQLLDVAQLFYEVIHENSNDLVDEALSSSCEELLIKIGRIKVAVGEAVSGVLSSETENFNLGEFAGEVGLGTEKVIVDISPPMKIANIDKNRQGFDIDVDMSFLHFRRVLANLVNNAKNAVIKDIKEKWPGRKNGSISVSANAQGKDLVLVVENDGPVIPNDEIDKITGLEFTTTRDEDTVSVEVGEEAGPEGTLHGTGLAMVELIVNHYGGDLDIEKDRQSGAKFTVTIPNVVVEKESPAPAAVGPTDPGVPDDGDSDLASLAQENVVLKEQLHMASGKVDYPEDKVLDPLVDKLIGDRYGEDDVVVVRFSYDQLDFGRAVIRQAMKRGAQVRPYMYDEELEKAMGATARRLSIEPFYKEATGIVEIAAMADKINKGGFFNCRRTVKKYLDNDDNKLVRVRAPTQNDILNAFKLNNEEPLGYRQAEENYLRVYCQILGSDWVQKQAPQAILLGRLTRLHNGIAKNVPLEIPEVSVPEDGEGGQLETDNRKLRAQAMLVKPDVVFSPELLEQTAQGLLESVDLQDGNTLLLRFARSHQAIAREIVDACNRKASAEGRTYRVIYTIAELEIYREIAFGILHNKNAGNEAYELTDPLGLLGQVDQADAVLSLLTKKEEVGGFWGEAADQRMPVLISFLGKPQGHEKYQQLSKQRKANLTYLPVMSGVAVEYGTDKEDPDALLADARRYENNYLRAASRNWSVVDEGLERLKGMADRAEKIVVTGPKGRTDRTNLVIFKMLEFDGEEKFLQDRGMNFPHGEVCGEPVLMKGTIVFPEVYLTVPDQGNFIITDLTLTIQPRADRQHSIVTDFDYTQIRYYDSNDEAEGQKIPDKKVLGDYFKNNFTSDEEDGYGKIGEFAIGTASGVEKARFDILLLEKIIGIHIALGDGVINRTGKIDHKDIIRQGVNVRFIYSDGPSDEGELILSADGRFIPKELQCLNPTEEEEEAAAVNEDSLEPDETPEMGNVAIEGIVTDASSSPRAFRIADREEPVGLEEMSIELERVWERSHSLISMDIQDDDELSNARIVVRALFDSFGDLEISIYTFNSIIEDLFGFARTDHRFVALNAAVAEHPVALFHEIGEYLLATEEISLSLKGRMLKVCGREGNEIGIIRLSDEALAIANKGVTNQHYLLRALQRRIFGQYDRSLTVIIKAEQLLRDLEDNSSEFAGLEGEPRRRLREQIAIIVGNVAGGETIEQAEIDIRALFDIDFQDKFILVGRIAKFVNNALPGIPDGTPKALVIQEIEEKIIAAIRGGTWATTVDLEGEESSLLDTMREVAARRGVPPSEIQSVYDLFRSGMDILTMDPELDMGQIDGSYFDLIAQLEDLTGVRGSRIFRVFNEGFGLTVDPGNIAGNPTIEGSEVHHAGRRLEAYNRMNADVTGWLDISGSEQVKDSEEKAVVVFRLDMFEQIPLVGVKAILNNIKGGNNVEIGLRVSDRYDRAKVEEFIDSDWELDGVTVHILPMDIDEARAHAGLQDKRVCFIEREGFDMSDDLRGNKIFAVSSDSAFHAVFLFSIMYARADPGAETETLISDFLTAMDYDGEINDVIQQLRDSGFFTIRLIRISELLEEFRLSRCTLVSA